VRSDADDHGKLTAHYEQLRCDALNRCAHGFGLALLLQQGMTAWMRAWAEWTNAPQTSAAATAPLAVPLPSAIRAQLTLILASVLTRPLQEARP
jgi:hypothetical protein